MVTATRELDLGDAHAARVASPRTLPWLTRDSVAFESDNPTVDEAMAAGTIGFTTELRPVYTHNPRGHRVSIPGWNANVRTDTESVLGLVGTRYTGLQNRPAFEIADDLREKFDARIMAAISIRGGRLSGLMVEFPGRTFEVPGDTSEHKMTLGIFNSHDGNSSVTGALGVLRGRCLNVLRPFFRSAVRSFKVRHTSSVEARTHEATRLLIGVDAYMAAFEREAARLAGIPLFEAQVAEILKAAWPISPDLSEGKIDATIAMRYLRAWRETDTLPEVRETAWGLLNAVAEFDQHGREYAGRTFDASDVRAYSVLQGTGAVAVDRVLATINRMAA